MEKSWNSQVVATLSNIILPCCSTHILPTSSTCKPSSTQRGSQLLIFEQMHKALQICPLDSWLGNVGKNGKPRVQPRAQCRDTGELRQQPICLVFHYGSLFLPSTTFLSASKLSFFFHSIFHSIFQISTFWRANAIPSLFFLHSSYTWTPKQVPMTWHN